MMDFELAMMNAIHHTLGPQVRILGCFFHLCKNTWKHIQNLGLAVIYQNDDQVKLWCGMLDGLAFLPVNDVAAGMIHLRQNVPAVFAPLLQYFDETYVSGKFCTSVKYFYTIL